MDIFVDKVIHKDKHSPEAHYTQSVMGCNTIIYIKKYQLYTGVATLYNHYYLK